MSSILIVSDEYETENYFLSKQLKTECVVWVQSKEHAMEAFSCWDLSHVVIHLNINNLDSMLELIQHIKKKSKIYVCVCIKPEIITNKLLDHLSELKVDRKVIDDPKSKPYARQVI